jgi:hypothetical protein
MAPSTVGTFLRAFTFGHTRQLDQLTERALAGAWAAGAGPGDAPMTIDADSTIVEVHGHAKQGASYGSTRTLGYHPLLATRAGSGEVLHASCGPGGPTPPAACPGSSTSWSAGSAAPAPAASSPSGWTRDPGRPPPSRGCATSHHRVR